MWQVRRHENLTVYSVVCSLVMNNKRYIDTTLMMLWRMAGTVRVNARTVYHACNEHQSSITCIHLWWSVIAFLPALSTTSYSEGSCCVTMMSRQWRHSQSGKWMTRAPCRIVWLETVVWRIQNFVADVKPTNSCMSAATSPGHRIIGGYIRTRCKDSLRFSASCLSEPNFVGRVPSRPSSSPWNRSL